MEGSLRSVGRVALADHVYDALYRNMLVGTIEPGVRLNIDQLARDLHVSPTPLREALARLEAEEVVAKRPLAGYQATPLLTRTGITELFDLRLQLEPWLAGLAAAGGGDWVVDHGARADSELARLAARDAGFHDTVAMLAGNALARQALRRLNSHFHIYRLFARSGEVPSDIERGHDSVAEAVRSHDKAAAARAMRRHLTDSRARLLAIADE